MIIFKKLTYQNFLSSGNTPIEIHLNQNDKTLIVGKNGSGKSTIISALSFALFGKTNRGIKKDQLVNSVNNGHCLVTIDFSIGNEVYSVRRGIKPNIFEIYHNSKLIDQDSKVKDYQKILENNILQFDFKTFHQVVILGSSSYTPFMQLPVGVRREVIEDLLDINIFSRMNSLVKAEIKSIQGLIKDNEIEIDKLSNEIELQQKHLQELQQMDVQQNLNKKKKIQELQDEIDLLTERNEKLKEEYAEIENVSTSLENHENEKEKLNKYLDSIYKKKKNFEKTIQFFTEQNTCPTCSQSITQEFRDSKISNTKNSLDELEKGISSLKEKIEEKENQCKKILQKYENLKEKSVEISKNNQMMFKLEKDVEKTQSEQIVSNESTESLEKDIEQKRKKVEEKEEIRSEYNVELQYNNVIFEMLKDSGIKTQIIKQYIPVINKLMNEYLEVLDFFVKFELNEEFVETIKSRHRDIFTYSSFSDGEKARLDLAILFTWRKLAALRNSVNTNLLIFDEVFDSVLDEAGVTNFLSILETLDESNNVFIISHKQDLMENKFLNQIEFVKKGLFTEKR